jgi:hypothetical protein
MMKIYYRDLIIVQSAHVAMDGNILRGTSGLIAWTNIGQAGTKLRTRIQ